MLRGWEVDVAEEITKAEAELLLGLAGEYTHDDMRRAHRRLLLECHPDARSGGGGDQLARRINAAKEALDTLFRTTGAKSLVCERDEREGRISDLEDENKELKEELRQAREQAARAANNFKSRVSNTPPPGRPIDPSEIYEEDRPKSESARNPFNEVKTDPGRPYTPGRRAEGPPPVGRHIDPSEIYGENNAKVKRANKAKNNEDSKIADFIVGLIVSIHYVFFLIVVFFFLFLATRAFG